MARPSSELSNEFRLHLQQLESVRDTMETLFVGEQLTEDEIEHVYSGLFLEAFTAFESLIEQLFISLLIGDFQSSESDVVMKATFNNYGIAQDIIFGGRNYVEWIPYESTLSRANAFFYDGYPFSRLKEDDSLKVYKSSIKRFAAIRNAIAHKSKYAQKTFENKVSGSSPLSPRQRKPAGYLRSTVNRTQIQYEVIVLELNMIAYHLCR